MSLSEDHYTKKLEKLRDQIAKSGTSLLWHARKSRTEPALNSQTIFGKLCQVRASGQAQPERGEEADQPAGLQLACTRMMLHFATLAWPPCDQEFATRTSETGMPR